MTACTESMNIEIASRGVIEANSLTISELSLKKLAHILCPNAIAKTSLTPTRRESFRLTLMAFFARLGWPAPNSFDTLVLSQ